MAIASRKKNKRIYFQMMKINTNKLIFFGHQKEINRRGEAYYYMFLHSFPMGINFQRLTSNHSFRIECKTILCIKNIIYRFI